MNLAVVDFESFWGPDYTLSGMTTESYIKDERFKAHGAGIQLNGGKNVWVTHEHLPAVLARIDWPNTTLIGHNLNFDGSILAWRYGHTPKRYLDTLGLSRAIIGPHSARHGLEYSAELLTGLKKYPGFLKESYGIRDLHPALEAKLTKYCAGPISECGQYAGDVTLTWELFKKLIPFMAKDELDALHWSVKIFTQPKILLDTELLQEYYDSVVRAKADVLKSVGLDNRDLLMSNPQYAEALVQLGVTPPMKVSEKTGKPSFAFAKTDEGHKALLEHPDIRVQALVAARMAVKSTIEETRSLAYLGASTRGAWPVDLRYAGAHTIRFSGGDGGGGNPQNLKRGGTLRNALYAAIQKIFLVADLSQIEARETLWIGSKMPEANAEFELLEVMRTGGDIYAYFGEQIYGMPISKKTHPYERQVAKSAVLGLGFGMGWKRFIEYALTHGVTLTEEESKRIVNIYRSMFTGVRASWKVIQDVILPAMLDNRWGINFPNDEFPLVTTAKHVIFDSPCLTLPGGLQLQYPNLARDENGQWSYLKAGNTKRSRVFGGFILENICQAVAGRLLREHIVQIEAVAQGKIAVVTNTHDELLMEIEDRYELNEYRAFTDAGEKLNPPQTPESKLVSYIMTKPPSYMPDIPIGIEYDYGYRYGDAK